MASATLWTDEYLDRMRQECDPLADEAVEKVFASHNTQFVSDLLDNLVNNRDVPADSLPPEISEYLQKSAAIAAANLRQAELGRQFFADHGPEILLIFACYSLPEAYSARRGVSVMYETAYLRNRPNKRLVETCQMVIDVLSPAGFGPRGRAIRTLQKVRLTHAAIRLLVRKSPRHTWIPDYGQPVNQEDLAGNLMALSWIVIDGLRRLGIAEASDEDKAESYLDAWREVGRFLGINAELLPDNLEQAEQLTKTIQRRQLDPSNESREMTAALLAMMRENSLPGMEGLPAALMRFFLADDIADRLGIPRDDLEDKIVRAWTVLNRGVDQVIEKIPARLLVFRRLSLRMIQWMLDLERDGKVTTFSIPQNLSENWGFVPCSENETLWDHLIHDFLPRLG